jgi:hypothetical protein
VQQGRTLDGERDALRCVDLDGVGEAEAHLHALALGDGPVTGAVDLEGLLVALRDADDHVVDEAARQAVQGPGLALVVGAGDRDGPVLALLDGDRLGQLSAELALGALHGNRRAIDLDVDAGGHQNRLLPNAGHA